VASVPSAAIVEAFSRLDPVSFGVAAGATSVLALGAATLFLLTGGGDAAHLLLSLVGAVLPGVGMSVAGALLGLLYFLVLGFVGGAGAAYIRNLMVLLSVRVARRDIELRLLRRLFDVN
jgi:hypothetical protein